MTTVATSRPVRAALGIAIALVVGACSGAASPSPAASTAPSSAAVAEASAGAGGTTYQLSVATGSVGSFLTGEDGRTLYVFKKDTAGSGKSVCNGTCAANWPPFTLESGERATAGTGVTGEITTITRDDGSTQVAYKGMPLYYYAADQKAGDTTGQGVGGVWFVAAP